ncbi:BnaCnng76290D [Brassica napus]|uniref:(rape) hypothetical protein n=1 Tax=Brassica napus TaxID=3708 RepID=A0A078JWZ8_BRANA|nr:unnamed protein product [Brassica napus]CDY72168.1 BnaCnng76290D [Brassica napus]
MRSRIGRGSSPLGDDSDLGKALCRLTRDHRMFF